jgi:hypothetical protein
MSSSKIPKPKYTDNDMIDFLQKCVSDPMLSTASSISKETARYYLDKHMPPAHSNKKVVRSEDGSYMIQFKQTHIGDKVYDDGNVYEATIHDADDHNWIIIESIKDSNGK